MADSSYEDIMSQIEKLKAEAEKLKEQARETARDDIDKILTSADMTLQELYPDEFDRYVRENTGARARGGSGQRAAGTPKYIYQGQPMDGRSARAESGFDVVRVAGKIDDKEAAKKFLLNPRWVEEQAVRLLNDLGIVKAEDYVQAYQKAQQKK